MMRVAESPTGQGGDERALLPSPRGSSRAPRSFSLSPVSRAPLSRYMIRQMVVRVRERLKTSPTYKALLEEQAMKRDVAAKQALALKVRTRDSTRLDSRRRFASARLDSTLDDASSRRGGAEEKDTW